jgi:hypothetical protein
MILRISERIGVFLVILFCFISGFASAFWLISKNDESSPFGTVSQALYNSYLYSFGQNIDYDFSDTSSPYLGTVLLVFFILVMMILMLNLLIALMGDAYSIARNEGEALWKRQRAEVILEQRFLYSAASQLESSFDVSVTSPLVRTSTVDNTGDRVAKHLTVIKYASKVDHTELDCRMWLSNFTGSSPSSFSRHLV